MLPPQTRAPAPTMKATTIRKSLLCSAIGACLMGTSAFATNPVVSTTGSLPSYKIIKASPSIDKLQRVKQTLVAPPNVPEHSLKSPEIGRAHV